MKRQSSIVLFLLILITWAIAGCSEIPLPFQASATPSPTVTPIATSTPTLTPTTTSTPLPPLVVLLAGEGSDSALVDLLQSQVAALAQTNGLRWQVRPSLNLAESADVIYVVAVPPVLNLQELVAGAPQTRFLVVGVSDLQPAPNLVSFGGGDAPDQQGFLAGYIAAMITPGWHVGVISVEDTAEGQAARAGFQNGVRFYCGLCRPLYPPFYSYPLYIGLPAAASQGEWRALVDYMVDRQVETVYVTPGAGGEDMYRYLGEMGVRIIGTIPPYAGLENLWVGSIRSQVDQVYLEQLTELFTGTSGISEPLPVLITDINAELFSPGKQRLAQEILADLQSGLIDTGVTPVP